MMQKRYDARFCFGAFPSFVLSKQLCDQGLRVEQAHAGWLAAARFSFHERFERLPHFRRHAETAHLTFECQRSLPGDAQFCPEELLDDPCHQNNLFG